jgi:transposase
MTSDKIANILGRGTRTVQYWIKRFNENGFAGLREKEGRGRPGTLEEKEIKRIGKDLRKSPRDFGHSQSLWDGKMLSHHIREKYGKNIGVRQCQRLFHELGFRLRKPRPLIAQADPIAKEAFKKTPEENK